MQSNSLVLVVHRDQGVRKRVSDWLIGAHFVPVVAEDEQTAFEQVRQHRPSVILCGEDSECGTDTLITRLGEDLMTAAIPIVALTTDGQFDLSSGANGTTTNSNGINHNPSDLLKSVQFAIDGQQPNGHDVAPPKMKPANDAPTAANGSRGFVVGLALSTVLQMLQLERATCILAIQSSDQTASIDIDGGEIIDASYGAYKGEDAIFEVLQWQNVQVEFRDPLPVKRRIALPLPHLLMESVRRLDEGTTQLLSERVLPHEEMRATETPVAVGDLYPLDVEQLNDLALQDGVLALAVIDAQVMHTWMIDDHALMLGEGAIQAIGEFVLANLTVQQKMGATDVVDDILVTMSNQYHFVKLLDAETPIFVYLVLDRQRSNIALVRRRVSKIHLQSPH